MRGPFRTRFSLALRALTLRLKLGLLLENNSIPELLNKLSHGPLLPASLDDVEEALAKADAWTAFLPFVPKTCLYRSLARYALMNRAGHHVQFVMAIDPPKAPRADLDGHAWVELNGKPVGEEVDERLIVTYAYPKAHP